jgi:hypothetical protein
VRRAKECSVMKLLYCPHCHDVRKLRYDPDDFPHPDGHGGAHYPELTKCECGKSWGRYTDDINAVYGGDAIMLGISNPSFSAALIMQEARGDRDDGIGRRVEAFIIPEKAPTVKREK